MSLRPQHQPLPGVSPDLAQHDLREMVFRDQHLAGVLMALKRVLARGSEAKIFIDEGFDCGLYAEFALSPAAFSNSLELNTDHRSNSQVFEKVRASVQKILQQRKQ